MSVFDWSKCSEPSDLVGDWSDRPAVSFADSRDPIVVKFAIEKMTRHVDATRCR